MPLQFVKSERGKDHLVHDGYRFAIDKVSDSKTTWNCVDRKRFKCVSRVHTGGGEVIFYKDGHNHVPDVAALKSKVILADLKDAAIMTSETPLAIVASKTAGLLPSVSATLPSIRAMKQVIQRKRRTTQYPLAIPTSLTYLQLPEVYKKTLNNENFLLFDSGPGIGRILIFGTERNVEMMTNSPNWFADGTFKVSPSLFEQVYTIHGIRQSDVIPLVFALLPDKAERTYTRLLTALKQINPRLNPQTIMTDFERAAFNAFRCSFPTADLSGCFFHFGQCLWRRLHQYPDLEKQYKESPEFALKIKCLSALALVPPEDVIAAFETLSSDAFYSSTANMERYMDYFEDTWIGKPRRRGRRAEPLFPVAHWNCFKRVVDDIAKTNNSVEGWHRGFHSMLGGDHPTIWRLIDGLKKEQSLNEIRMNQYLAGQNHPPSRRQYRDSADRLKRVVLDYGNRTIIDYLTGVAHNLNLAV